MNYYICIIMIYLKAIDIKQEFFVPINGGTEGEKPPNGLYINVDNNYPNGETVYKGSYKKVTVNKNITFPAGIKFGYSTIENLQPFVDSLETTTDYSYMFESCKSLKKIRLNDTDSVLSFKYCFAQCTSLESVGEINCASCTDAGAFFYGCRSLYDVNLINTGNIVMANGCFNNTAIENLILEDCHSLETAQNLVISNNLKVLKLYKTYKLRDLSFNGNRNLEEFFIEDASKLDSNLNFSFLPNLKSAGSFKDYGKGFTGRRSFLLSKNGLSLEAIEQIINDIATVTINGCSISISKSIYDQLPNEIKELATSKNWTLRGQ